MEATFRAADLALIYRSVHIAKSTDEGRPLLRGIRLDNYPGAGIRLTATDSYILITGWVPVIGDGDTIQHAPDVYDTPDVSYTLADPDGHLLRLMTWAAKEAKDLAKIGDAPSPVMKLTVGEDRTGFALEGMNPTVATFHAPTLGKTFRTTIIEGPYANWQLLFAAKPSGLKGPVGFGSQGVLRLGKLAEIWGAACLEMSFSGAESPVRVAVKGGGYDLRETAVECEGLAMPVRLSRNDSGSTSAVPIHETD